MERIMDLNPAPIFREVRTLTTVATYFGMRHFFFCFLEKCETNVEKKK
jgi:hypothetical protein